VVPPLVVGVTTRKLLETWPHAPTEEHGYQFEAGATHTAPSHCVTTGRPSTLVAETNVAQPAQHTRQSHHEGHQPEGFEHEEQRHQTQHRT